MVALPFTFLKYLKAKEELWKFKYFTLQKYNPEKKNPLKEIKIFQDIITLELWFVQVIDLFVILPNPNHGVLTHLSTSKVLRARERAPNLCLSAVSTEAKISSFKKS